MVLHFPVHMLDGQWGSSRVEHLAHFRLDHLLPAQIRIVLLVVPRGKLVFVPLVGQEQLSLQLGVLLVLLSLSLKLD